MKKEKMTKAQYSKNLRRVLLRHQIDLSQIQFSASAHSVNLSGLLMKNTGTEVSVPSVIELQKELSRMGQISTDLSNWIITNDSISKIERQEKKAAPPKKEDNNAA